MSRRAWFLVLLQPPEERFGLGDFPRARLWFFWELVFHRVFPCCGRGRGLSSGPACVDRFPRVRYN